MNIKQILEKMDSIASEENTGTSSKFPGYLKGKDSADKVKTKLVGSTDESVLPELSKTANESSMLRKLEEKFKTFKEEDKVADRYEPEDFDAMVKRVSALAKAGPMKTVWDPVKRVYKNVPVKQEKEISEYGNATDPNNQSTNPAQQKTNTTGTQTTNTTTNTEPVDPAAQAKMQQQAAQQAAQQIKSALGTDVQPNILASAMTKSENGKQLTPQELDAMGKVSQVIGQAAKSGILKSPLQQAAKALGK